MPSLSTQQIQHLTELMDQRYEREMKEIGSVVARSRDEQRQEIIVRPSDLLDAALAEMTLAADYAVVRQDVQDVRDIIAARRRLAAGTYGVCVDCDEDIAYERLEAYPTAKRCIGCQQTREARITRREG
jgi:RNA polymerase-binding transcription factor DksA